MRMRPTYRILRYLILLDLVLVIGINTVRAQDADIQASAPSVVKEGTAFNYVVSGGQQGQVTISPPDGIRIVGGPSQMISYQSSNVNGRLENVMQISYTYSLMPEKTGDFIIPPAVLKSGRKEYRSNEVRIKVVERASEQAGSGEPETVIMQLIPSRRSIYEGEQIVVSTKILIRERIQQTSQLKRNFEGFWVDELEGDNFARTENYEGFQYRTQVIARDLITAQKKGNLRIGPSQMDVNIQKVVRRNRGNRFDDFFDDPFFQSYENVPSLLKTNTLTIEVKPLPAGAPASFSGAVGKFNARAVLTKDTVEVNESVAIKLSISGTGNLGLISAPAVDFPPDFDVLEPVKTTSLKHDINGTSGTVSFEYVIIPRHGGTYRIAPVDFSFFNPSTGKYDRYISGEFEFYAKGEETEQVGNIPVQPGFFREDVRDLNSDIGFIKLGNPVYFIRGYYIVNNNWYYLVFLSGILQLIFSYFYWRNRMSKESDIFYVRNKKAWKLASRRLKTAKSLMHRDDEGIYEEILKAVNGYLSDRLAMNTADISRDRIEKELIDRHVDPDLITRLRELLDDCEMARYSNTYTSGKQVVYDKAVTCLSDIEQKL